MIVFLLESGGSPPTETFGRCHPRAWRRDIRTVPPTCLAQGRRTNSHRFLLLLKIQKKRFVHRTVPPTRLPDDPRVYRTQVLMLRTAPPTHNPNAKRCVCDLPLAGLRLIRIALFCRRFCCFLCNRLFLFDPFIPNSHQIKCIWFKQFVVSNPIEVVRK